MMFDVAGTSKWYVLAMFIWAPLGIHGRDAARYSAQRQLLFENVNLDVHLQGYHNMFFLGAMKCAKLRKRIYVRMGVMRQALRQTMQTYHICHDCL